MEPENQKNRLDMLLKSEAEEGYDTFTSYAIALELITLDKATEALNRFKDIIEREPAYLPSYFQAGRLLESQGNELSALHFYQRALAHGDAESDHLTWKEINAAIAFIEDDESF